MSDEHHWMKRHGDYAVRATTEEEEAEGTYGMRGDHCYLLCRVSTGEVLGCDGGEPEDQILIRDWDWVPWACDDAEKRGAEKAWAEAIALVESCFTHYAHAELHAEGEAVEAVLDRMRAEGPPRDALNEEPQS